MTFSRILSTGAYLPVRRLENHELEQRLDTSDEWIRTRTGIRCRHLAAAGEGTCDMAEQAARRALENATLEAAEIDLIVVATVTPDLVFPSTACLLQERLGVSKGAAFDVQAACAGFLHALDLADKFIRCGSARTALVLGADTMSRLLDWQDRGTCVLFGDGAGAVVLQAAGHPGLLASELRADGRHHRLLYTPRTAPGDGEQAGESAVLHMQGREVFRRAITLMQEAAKELLRGAGVALEQVDWLIPHQANERILRSLAKRLGMPMEKVILTLAEHGNTSAASIPLALDCALQDGRVQRGHKLLLQAFGGGFAWGTALVDF